ncbi:MAG: prenyltransferase [Ilumatobacter coccineus]|uniref:Prenyltransferase n=1 Tax=Ilumatobacter coccineus TaxID=467094 RepID=A0A2G6KB75_9ACTN|nr:MAG: prenyltransferase [Ilumatobacter coccineus]
MTTIPDLPGVISADEIVASAHHLASLQTESGMIPWWPGGHCDPWNHVESAMALDIAGLHDEAERAYGWLADIQRTDGAWHNYYVPDGAADDTVEDAKLDTNVCAYIGAGVWHHWRCTGDDRFVERIWPTVERALDWVLAQRRADGLPLWAVEVDAQPWDYALVAGTCSIQHSLRHAAEAGAAIGRARPEWIEAADQMAHLVRTRPEAFEPKTRWAMDWYYPVLTGVLADQAGRDRLADGWPTFAMEGLGVRCVSDEPWVTASETAEAALSYAAVGELDTATDLVAWTRPHRMTSGAYLTGLVYPDQVIFPADEHSSYTTAAVILAVDAITGASPASRLFAPAQDRSYQAVR